MSATTSWRERPCLLRSVTSLIDELPVPSWFAREQPLEIEFGCGDGSFMARYAALHPERNFLAVERLKGRLMKLDRAARRAAMENVALVLLEAGYLMKYLLPEKCCEAVHVYFPDPWPKKKHRQHRLVSPAFTGQAARLLRTGGHVWLRTDDEDYHEQMLEVFAADARFEPVETPADLAEVRTDFETEFNERGIPTRYAAYRLRA